LVKAVEDVHQGLFASTVLAQQSQYLAFIQGQVNVIIC
jgi:hypothetical protein